MAVFPDLSADDGAVLLDVELVGSTDVTLSQPIEELGNSDWVAQGQMFLERKPDTCPFCQQEATAGLLEQLADYFDARYAIQTKTLGTYVDLYKQAVTELLDHLEQLVE